MVVFEKDEFEKFGFSWFCMNFGQLAYDDYDDYDYDEKVIPKTASVGRGQKLIDIRIKINILKGNFNVLLNERMASCRKLGTSLLNKVYQK